ncbi:MAG: cupin domain-containing protein [Chlamydiales bacterium]
MKSWPPGTAPQYVRPEFLSLLPVRPWGSYTVLEEGPRYKIKRISVKPLQKLSLQMHYHRSEHWVVVTGTANVTIQEKERIVHEGESIFVPKSAIHRMENPGKVPLEIIEVQVGEYLGEDDIIRLEDIYGRLKEEESFNILLNSKT